MLLRSEFLRILFLFTLTLSFSMPALADKESIARGRYLAIITGCNDCHTSGYAPANGKIPEATWLEGDEIGWKGPWGISYPVNLRLLVSRLPKESWITFLKNSKARPPMPTYIFGAMSDYDINSLYDFIVSLGPSDKEIPAGLPPGIEPKTPYFNFTPVMPLTHDNH